MNFTESPILPEYASILAKSIQNCKDLLYLDLTLCKINDQSAESLISAVKNHPAIISLELADNQIKNNKGGKLIAELLRNNHNLLSLNLYGNNLGMEGKTLYSALKSNDRILLLNVIGTNMFIDTEESINEKIARNRKSFKEKIIKQKEFESIRAIPESLINYRDSLIPKSVDRPLKLSSDPIVFIGQWQSKQQPTILREVENVQLNTLVQYVNMKEKGSELQQKENKIPTENLKNIRVSKQ